ncbi:MAG: hypothetical protein ACI378_00830 [Bacteroides sp.]
MADILRFTIINTKMTRFYEKVSSKQVILGRFFAILGRFVADNRFFSSKKHLFCCNNHSYHCRITAVVEGVQ